MRALRLGSHRQHDVVVDHCAACRLVWFDPLESVHLDATGWVRLLRELGQPGPPPAPQGAIARPACPSCAAPLKAVRNRTRFGLFSALECPAGHGHLHSHAGALAERGLVRPLAAPERRALLAERHPLACFNCGGPAQAGDDQCSWCGTPLVVIDLPRLAHSLRPRTEAEAPAPQQPGRRVAWSCRGCGAPLDPGRETSCSRCGHLVVALEMADVEPLLQAAEAELAALAQQQAHRSGAIAGARRERLAREQAAPIRTRRERPRGPIAVAVWIWSALLLLALGAAALLLFDRLGPSPRALERLQQQRLSGVAEVDWGWLEAQRLLGDGQPYRTEALRWALFERHGRLAAGLPLEPAQPRIGGLIDSALRRSGGDPPGQREAWQLGLQRHLRPSAAVAAPDDPPADEVARLGRLTPAAPAVWLDLATRQSAIWTPTLENTGPLPLVLSSAQVRMMVDRLDGMPWRCVPVPRAGAVTPPPRDPRQPERPLMLRPGERVAMVCRATMALQLLDRLWTAVVPQLQAGTMPTLVWDVDLLRSSDGREAMAELLAAEGARRSLPADRFLRAHTQLRAAAPPLAGGVDAAVTPPRLAERWAALPPARRTLVWAALGIAVVAAFGLLTRLLGERRGAVAVWLATAPVAYAMGAGEGAASVLLVGMYWGLAAIALFALTFALRVVRGLLGTDLR